MPAVVTRICRASRRGTLSFAMAAYMVALAAGVCAFPVYGAAAERGYTSARLVLDAYPEGSGAAEPAEEAPATEPEENDAAPAPGGKARESAVVLGSGSSGASAAPEKAPDGEARKPALVTRLFGTVEFRSPIKNLPKWERVRNAEGKKPSFTPEGLDAADERVVRRWSALKAKIEDAPLAEQIREVNKFFNQWPYKGDREVWGVEDYWAIPREFVRKSGDCEDYAISKYYALRDLGVPANILRVAAIKDVIRNLGHAVLIVYMNGDAYILDNLTNLVLSHKKLSHYAPQYSVNEEYLWRHVRPKAAPRVPAGRK